MNTTSQTPPPKWTRKHTVWAAFGLAFVFAVPLPFTLGHAQASSEYGALLQGVSSTVALALLLWTLHLQRHDLHLQREELKLNRKEMQESTQEQKRQREQMEGQLEVMKQQAENATRSLDASINPRVMPRFEFNSDANCIELGVENIGNGKALLDSVAIFLPEGEVELPSLSDAGVEGFVTLARHFSTLITTRTPVRPGKCLMPGERVWLVGYDINANHLRHAGRIEWDRFLAFLPRVEVVLEWSNILGEDLEGTDLSFFPK